ncbi:hypothetical protein B0T20DRAFT_416040 [Sordaria brevicollis]|uniref:Secreted protein n=1 Tax=Sordaria brevicollis TaxID=83679 RepID=A0AAE0UBF1_SORBR|nr:hypothetical protein B0T20DRAFT_416040 [Sordaria brevicollis]
MLRRFIRRIQDKLFFLCLYSLASLGIDGSLSECLCVRCMCVSGPGKDLWKRTFRGRAWGEKRGSAYPEPSIHHYIPRSLRADGKRVGVR